MPVLLIPSLKLTAILSMLMIYALSELSLYEIWQVHRIAEPNDPKCYQSISYIKSTYTKPRGGGERLR